MTLPRPAKLGERVTFTVAYAGRDPKIGLRFVERLGRQSEARLAPTPGRRTSTTGSPATTIRTTRSPTSSSSRSRPATRSPPTAGSSGVTEDTAAGTVTWHWSQDLPHSTYLIFFAAAPYVVVKDSFGTLPVNYWVYPQDEGKAMPTYGKTPKMIAFFNKTFGYDYPWQKYDQVSVPLGGGAESTSATAMTHRIMVDAADEAGLPGHRHRLPRAGPPVVGRPHHPPELGPRLAERELRDLLRLPVPPLRDGRGRGRPQPGQQAEPPISARPRPATSGPSSPTATTSPATCSTRTPTPRAPGSSTCCGRSWATSRSSRP